MKEFFRHTKVVELSNVLAGPAVGMFFAELGARVIKVENKRTGGDVTRSWKLPAEDNDSKESAYFHSVNWGKEHLFLDLHQRESMELLMRHLEDADIVITNFKTGAAEKLQLDYRSLSARFPRLIYASITAYGKDDPRPGFDVALQAETGWLHMTGDKGGEPCKLPVALIDLLAAHQLKEGILIALLDRHSTGRGAEVTVSLFDSAISALANQASNWLNLGVVPERLGTLHPNIAPYGEVFRTADGKALLVSTGTADHFVQLCKCLNLDLYQDTRFTTNASRIENRGELFRILEMAFLQRNFDDLYTTFQEKQVPVVPIRNLQEVFELPAARRLVLESADKEGSVSRRVRTVVFNID